ncbi:hypothetical protein ACS0TY_004135 [Phlomoides rotata]
MATYQKIVAYLFGLFDQIYIELIPRLNNLQANALARLATSERAAELSEISSTKIITPSTLDYMVAHMDTDNNNWMTPIIEYLTNMTLSQNSTKASRLRIWSARYTMINDRLYKRGFSLHLLRCITKEQGCAIL